MELFSSIREVLGLVMIIGLGLNFFYQGFKALRKVQTRNYEVGTVHTFKCRNCEEIFQLNGVEAKERISMWSTRLETRTPTGQTNAIRFECPECQENAFHDRIFDTDKTALAGNVRAQFNEESRQILVDLMLKGFLPVLIGMPIAQMLLP